MTASKSWQQTLSKIKTATDAAFREQPRELRQLELGYIKSGAGSGGQTFSVLVHLEAYLMVMSQDIFFRLLKVANYDNVSLDLLVKMTKEFTHSTFDLYEFMADLGLEEVAHLGEEYISFLETLESKDDYIALTGALGCYFARLHKWVHFAFPWNFGAAYPHRSLEDLRELV